MKNKPLQRAMILSLIRKSIVLSEEKKMQLLNLIPTLSSESIEELQQLIGKEERVILHPKHLGIQELIETGDAATVLLLKDLLKTSMKQLHTIEQSASQALDEHHINLLLKQLS
jgi:hypothetical protein